MWLYINCIFQGLKLECSLPRKSTFSSWKKWNVIITIRTCAIWITPNNPTALFMWVLLCALFKKLYFIMSIFSDLQVKLFHTVLLLWGSAEEGTWLSGKVHEDMSLLSTESDHWLIKVIIVHSDWQHLSRVSGDSIPYHLLSEPFNWTWGGNWI